MRETTPFRVKMVERTGRRLKEILMRSDPWEKEPCGRPQCTTCQQDPRGGNCTRQGVLYKTTCLKCKSMGRDSNYIGESGRSLQERIEEHMQDAQGKSTTSHMETHRSEEHPEAEDSSLLFRADLISTAPSALVRMVREAVLIREYGGDNLLNDVLEYNRCLLPEITTKVGQRVMEEPKETREVGLETLVSMSETKRSRDDNEEEPNNNVMTRRLLRIRTTQ